MVIFTLKGWNISKTISRLIGLRVFAVCRRQHNGSAPKGSPQILAGIGVGYCNCGSLRTKLAMSLKLLKIERKLLLTASVNWRQNV